MVALVGRLEATKPPSRSVSSTWAWRLSTRSNASSLSVRSRESCACICFRLLKIFTQILLVGGTVGPARCRAVTRSSLEREIWGQIGHNVANGSPPLRHFSEEAGLPGRNDAEVGSPTCYTLRRNITSKIWFWLISWRSGTKLSMIPKAENLTPHRCNFHKCRWLHVRNWQMPVLNLCC